MGGPLGWCRQYWATSQSEQHWMLQQCSCVQYSVLRQHAPDHLAGLRFGLSQPRICRSGGQRLTVLAHSQLHARIVQPVMHLVASLLE